MVATGQGVTSSGAELIKLERARQRTVHGHTLELDDKHESRELVWAAIYYAEGATAHTGVNCRRFLPEPIFRFREDPDGWAHTVERVWPWPTSPDPEPKDQDEIRCLVKAGALLAAEIDRRLRQRGRESVLGASAVTPEPEDREVCDSRGAAYLEFQSRVNREARRQTVDRQPIVNEPQTVALLEGHVREIREQVWREVADDVPENEAALGHKLVALAAVAQRAADELGLLWSECHQCDGTGHVGANEELGPCHDCDGAGRFVRRAGGAA